MNTEVAIPVQASPQANITPIPRVHCLVHPGFDAGNHLDFEAYLHEYIEHIATQTKDILLIVSDGEVFDEEQRKQLEHMRTIEGISLFLGLHDGGMGDLIEVYDADGKYSKALENNDLDERFYNWCKENIDMSELQAIADEWRELKKDYYAGKYRDNEEGHSVKAAILREKEEQARVRIDIASLSYKALDDLGVLTTPMNPTRRAVRNRPRFNRLYQHALQALGKERMREIFIADAEQEDTVPIQPISHFRTLDDEFLPTPIVPPLSNFQAQVFNASEARTYGNGAELRDKITYELSLSRYKKLLKNQPAEVLQDMNFPVTPETEFIFSGEYRGRCVSNTARVMRARLKGIAGDKFYIANDALTLVREDDGKEEETF